MYGWDWGIDMTFDFRKDFLYVDNCPLCGEPVRVAGRVDRLPTIEEIDPLMGAPGHRWLICQEGDWAHFERVDRLYDGAEWRWTGLAYIMPEPDEDGPVESAPGGEITQRMILK